MSRPYINNYISSLQKQIADAAVKIKQKQGNLKFSDVNDIVSEDVFNRLSRVEADIYNLVDSDVMCTLAEQQTLADSSYATEMYDTVAKTNNKSTVIEGLVFKNNREFDFKV
jgi:hypothetical protein